MATNITVNELINIGDTLRITFDGIDYDGYISSSLDFSLFSGDTQSLPFALWLNTRGSAANSLSIEATDLGAHTLKISRLNNDKKSLDYTLLPTIYNSSGNPVDLLDILNSLSTSEEQYYWNPPTSSVDGEIPISLGGGGKATTLGG